MLVRTAIRSRGDDLRELARASCSASGPAGAPAASRSSSRRCALRRRPRSRAPRAPGRAGRSRRAARTARLRRRGLRRRTRGETSCERDRDRMRAVRSEHRSERHAARSVKVTAPRRRRRARVDAGGVRAHNEEGAKGGTTENHVRCWVGCTPPARMASQRRGPSRAAVKPASRAALRKRRGRASLSGTSGKCIVHSLATSPNSPPSRSRSAPIRNWSLPCFRVGLTLRTARPEIHSTAGLSKSVCISPDFITRYLALR